MAEQHTPGPWEKGNPFTCGSETVKHYLITGPDGRTVADVGLWLDKLEEQEANADLIVAAPELLEALRDIASTDAVLIDQLGDELLLEGTIRKIIRVAQAAIAKATAS